MDGTNVTDHIQISVLEAGSASKVIVSNASSMLTESAVTSTELGYLSGALSNIQTQLNAKLTSTLASAKVFVGSAGNLAVGVSLSGDITNDNAGAVTIANSAITNAKVSATAAIAYSKLNLAASIVNADIGPAAAIAYSKLNLALSIVNADVNASAAIAVSKLAALTASRAMVTDGSGFASAATTTATEIGYVNGVTSAIQTQLNAKQSTTLTSAHLLIGSAGNVATDTALSGDATITNGGVLTIANSAITNAKVDAAAAIAYSKLNLATSIVNGDISASAAIAYSKLAALTSAHLLIGSAGNVATDTAVTGDVTIDNAGVTAIGSNKVTDAMIATQTTTKISTTNKSLLNSSILYFDAVNSIVGNTVTLTQSSLANVAMLIDPSTTGNNIGQTIKAYAGNPSTQFQRAQGTQASPTTISASGQVLGANAGAGYDGTSYVNSANFRYVSTQAFTATAHGTQVQLRSCPNGSVTVATGLVVDQDQSVIIGANQRLVFQDTNLTSARTFTYPDKAGEVAIIGLKDMYIAAAAFATGFSTGTIGGGPTGYTTINFASGLTTTVYVSVVMPRNWNNGTVKARVYWECTNASTNSVVWYVAGAAVADNTTINPTYGTDQTVTDANNGANLMNITAQTASITIANTPADTNMINLRVQRQAGVGSDNLAFAAAFIGLSIEYTEDASVAA